MSNAAAFRRLVVMVLPLAVVVGCMQTASVHDDRSTIADDPMIGLVVDVDLASASSAVAPPRPADESAGRDGRDAAASGQPDGAGIADAPEAPGSPGPAGPVVAERPAWLGTIPLPRAPADGSALPTPPELVDRRLPPPTGGIPREPGDRSFTATVGQIPPDVLARSTWTPECPIPLEDLRYLTVAHWGFDGRVHTGEIIVHASAAEGMVGVFERLHAARFPIEELRVISMADVNGLSTGDTNVSSAFVCRKKVSGRSWSEHSYGLAVDLNPFHNPYLSGTLVVPGLAGSYLDRSDVRPGMITPGDEVVRAFADIGWQWGGDWNRQKDWMHFSASGR